MGLSEGEGGVDGSIVHKYKILGKAGEGTFSEVLKGVHIHTKKYVAIKRMKQKFQSVQQVNNLREVQALRRLNPHSHIIGLREIIFDRRVGSLSLVCELSDMNLYELIRSRSRPMPELKVQHYIYQLFLAIDHTHRAGIYHRDIKPENILITKETLKVADFGSCRSVYSKQPLTEYISTRWYRPPECLLTEGRYGYKMDLWAAGCVMYELSTLRPLFPGSNELDQLYRIHGILGTPPERVLSKFYQFRNRQIPWDFPERSGTGIERSLGALMSKNGINLLYKLLKYDPEDRITARLALRSEWCQAYKLHRKSQKENVVRESSRDSGVDVTSRDTPTQMSHKNEENNFKNKFEKSQIPKYKFNQKKYNLRKHIQKPQFESIGKLPQIDTKIMTKRKLEPEVRKKEPKGHHHGVKGHPGSKLGPGSNQPIQISKFPKSKNFNSGIQSHVTQNNKKTILPKINNQSPRIPKNNQRDKSNEMILAPQVKKLESGQLSSTQGHFDTEQFGLNSISNKKKQIRKNKK